MNEYKVSRAFIMGKLLVSKIHPPRKIFETSKLHGDKGIDKLL